MEQGKLGFEALAEEIGRHMGPERGRALAAYVMTQREKPVEHTHTGVEVRSAPWYVKHLSQAHGLLLSDQQATGMSLAELTDLHQVKHESASGPVRPPSSQVLHVNTHQVTLSVAPAEWMDRPDQVRDIVAEAAARRGWVLVGDPLEEADEVQGLLLSWMAKDHERGVNGAIADLQLARARARQRRGTMDVKSILLTDPESRGKSWAQEPDWRRSEDGTTGDAEAAEGASGTVGGAGDRGTGDPGDLRRDDSRPE